MPQPQFSTLLSTPLSCVQLYIENILALQAKAEGRGRRGLRLQLAIMTSDDTHARTEALLRAHGHFGADPSQIHLIKQEKVRGVIMIYDFECAQQLGRISVGYRPESYQLCRAAAVPQWSVALHDVVQAQHRAAGCRTSGHASRASGAGDVRRWRASRTATHTWRWRRTTPLRCRRSRTATATFTASALTPFT